MALTLHGNNGVITTNGTAAAPSFAAPDTDTGLYFGTNLIHATTSGTNRFNIDANGRVLIGLTSSTNDNTLTLQGSSSGNYNSRLELRRGGNPSSGQGLGTIYFANNAGKWGAGIYAAAAENWTSGSAHGTDLVFQTVDNTTTTLDERVRITQNGKVGIGSNNPDVYSADADNLILRTTSSTGMTIRSGSTSGGSIFFANDDNNTSNEGIFQYLHNDKAFILNNYGGGNEKFIYKNRGTEALRIASDGDVTITSADAGATGPTLKLFHNSASPADNDIVGVISMHGDDDAGNETEFASINTKVTDVSNGTEQAHLSFYTRGLGSRNEIFRLVNRSSASAPSYTTDDHNGIILDVYNTGNPYPRYMNFIAKSAGNTDSNITFWTESVGGSPTEKLRITSGGILSWTSGSTVMSGTGNSYSLNIYRDGGSGYAYLDCVTGSSNHTGWYMRAYHNGTYNNVIAHNTSDYTYFQTGGNTRLNITSGGIIEVHDSVTLSSNAPSVKGKIRISGPSNATTAGGLEFHTSSGGGGGYGGRITCDANGHMRFHTRANNSGWGDKLLITADGEIRCTGAADNKGFSVWLDGTRRVAEIIEHSSDGELRLYTGESTPVLRTVLTSYGDSYINAAGTGKLLMGTTSSNAPNGSIHIANAFLRLQAGNQNSSNFSQEVGIEWSQESGSDVQVGKIVMRRDAWGGAPHNMDFYTRNYSNSVIRALILHYNQNASLTGSLTQNASDIRLKENIQPITNALEKVNSLSGFTFNWNQKGQDLGFTGEGHDDVQVGLSAQDVEKIQPEVVKPAPIDNDYKTIQYEKLVPLLLESIKELSTQVESLKEEITILKGNK